MATLLIVLGALLIGRSLRGWQEDAPRNSVQSRAYKLYMFIVLLALVIWMEEILFAFVSVLELLFATAPIG